MILRIEVGKGTYIFHLLLTTNFVINNKPELFQIAFDLSENVVKLGYIVYLVF
jgi:hypothetical protein